MQNTLLGIALIFIAYAINQLLLHQKNNQKLPAASARFNYLGWAPWRDSVGLIWVYSCVHTLTGNSSVGWVWLGNLSSVSRVSHPPSGTCPSVTRRASLWWKQKHKRKPAQFCLQHLQISCTRQTSKMIYPSCHSYPCEIPHPPGMGRTCFQLVECNKDGGLS